MSASTDFAALLDQYVVDQVSAATNPLRATIGDLTQQLADRDTTIAARNDLIGALQQRITDLEAQLAARPAAPSTATGTAFGTNVETAAAVDKARARGYSTFRRFYGPGDAVPSSWSNDALLAKSKPGDAWIISHKDATDAQVTAFLKTVPTGVNVWMCKFHEPEDNFTTDAQKSDYRAGQASHAKVVRAAGFKSCTILMGYTANPNSGRNWRDWYSPDVDALFWDAYNAGNKKSPPVLQSVSNIMGDLLPIIQETGKPWGVTETGAKVDCVASNGYANRADWCAAYAQAIKDNGGLFGIYWDSISNSGTSDYRLDDACVNAWR